MPASLREYVSRMFGQVQSLLLNLIRLSVQVKDADEGSSRMATIRGIAPSGFLMAEDEQVALTEACPIFLASDPILNTNLCTY